MQKRRVPTLIDEPIKIMFFDKEDGIVFVSSIIILTVFWSNLLMILLISFSIMLGLNRVKSDKPRGFISQFFYRYYNFSLPVKYHGRKTRIRI